MTLKVDLMRNFNLQGKRVLPYYDRAALASAATLKGKELVWVDDAVDAFFLQVQGSGRVVLDDGGVTRLGYGDSNGNGDGRR